MSENATRRDIPSSAATGTADSHSKDIGTIENIQKIPQNIVVDESQPTINHAEDSISCKQIDSANTQQTVTSDSIKHPIDLLHSKAETCISYPVSHTSPNQTTQHDTESGQINASIPKSRHSSIKQLSETAHRTSKQNVSISGYDKKLTSASSIDNLPKERQQTYNTQVPTNNLAKSNVSNISLSLEDVLKKHTGLTDLDNPPPFPPQFAFAPTLPNINNQINVDHVPKSSFTQAHVSAGHPYTPRIPLPYSFINTQSSQDPKYTSILEYQPLQTTRTQKRRTRHGTTQKVSISLSTLTNLKQRLQQLTSDLDLNVSRVAMLEGALKASYGREAATNNKRQTETLDLQMRVEALQAKVDKYKKVLSNSSYEGGVKGDGEKKAVELELFKEKIKVKELTDLVRVMRAREHQVREHHYRTVAEHVQKLQEVEDVHVARVANLERVNRVHELVESRLGTTHVHLDLLTNRLRTGVLI